jgi:hypothetical protein
MPAYAQQYVPTIACDFTVNVATVQALAQACSRSPRLTAARPLIHRSARILAPPTAGRSRQRRNGASDAPSGPTTLRSRAILSRGRTTTITHRRLHDAEGRRAASGSGVGDPARRRDFRRAELCATGRRRKRIMRAIQALSGTSRPPRAPAYRG